MITAVCFLVGWQANRVRVQRDAFERIKGAGGYMTLSSQCGEDGIGPPPTPRWNPLRGRVDDLWFDSVFSLQTPHLNEDLRRAGAKYLSRDIYEQALRLPNLRYLSLSCSDISNEEVAALARLQELKILDLSCSRIEEGPLPGLADLQLKWLSINRTRLDDKGVKSLRGMTKLQHLDLTRTKVTDDSLQHLETLTRLKKLVLRRTLVTQAGVQELRGKLPRCEISWEPLIVR